MAIAIECKACGRKFRVKDAFRGREGQCPGCGQTMTAEGPRVPDHDVFISHAQKDKAVADAVCASLEGRGVRCWIAPRDIGAGVTWGGAIIDAIGESRVMVLIFSESSNRSEQVLREVERAVAKGVVILPLRIEEVTPSKDFEYFLSARHWLDAMSPPLENHLQKLTGHVQSLLGNDAPVIQSKPEALDVAKAAHAPVEALPKDTLTLSKRTLVRAATVAGVFVLGAMAMMIWPRGQHVPAGGNSPIASVQPAPVSTPPAPAPVATPVTKPPAAKPANVKEQTFAGIEFVWIQPGEFMMGSPESEAGRQASEGPQHKVTISRGFWLGKYEVTQAQWESVMGNNPSVVIGAQNPVDSVSWNDCQGFIQKMNTKGLGQFRLPSEAEWEYACRAGSITAYSFGNDASAIDRYAWCDINSGMKVHPVGQKEPNAWGLYDMYGNVLEWCQDWYHNSYAGAPSDGSAWESPLGDNRMFRGCSGNSPALFCRSAFRGSHYPTYAGYTFGFRLARNP